MDARILTVGSELLGDLVDTNGPEVARRLTARGFRVRGLAAVPDDLDLLASELGRALSAGGLVVATGGLGPTHDDVTRDAAARATGRELREDPELRARLHAAALARGAGPPAASERQALVLEGAELVPNDHGTAPGQVQPVPGGVLVLLPGPPGELFPMLPAALAAAESCLAEAGLSPPGEAALEAELRMAGLGESEAARRIDEDDVLAAALARGDLAHSWLARPGDVSLRLRSPHRDVLERAVAAAATALAPHVYSTDGRSLAEVVVPVLAERFETLTAAESCTGGLLAAALTSVPGCSQVFRQGIVAYGAEAKARLLGVAPQALEQRGAVSSEVAEAMAAGARRLAGADWAVALTGYAGPATEGRDEPVGLVHLGLAHPDGRVESVERHFGGSRDAIRQRAVQAALDLLRRRLLPEP